MSVERHTVSVVIPTLGRDTLTLCRAALAKQTRQPDEVIVVVDQQRRGVAWARNEGIAKASGDLIAFADDDGIPPEDWLERLIAALDRHDAAAAGGTFQETDPLLDAIRRRNPLPTMEQLDPGGLVGNGGNLLIKRDWLDACMRDDGYVFNPSFAGSGEDWELIWRLRKRGARVVYVPVPVAHLRQANVGQHLRHSFQRGAGIARLFRVMRADRSGIIPQDSLLWGRAGRKADPRWGRALWEKLFGPFDWGRFHNKRHFWLFWIGEKCQAVGFLWELWRGTKTVSGATGVSVERPADSYRMESKS
ncbi:MAG: Glycosyl transferase, family 2 [Nitrospira sp.]|jgi:glycosyltransferase involved in cell wall biosynthesis|nr:MAG: Glycosyl transferase, family 2 [Nitrospira sp.]